MRVRACVCVYFLLSSISFAVNNYTHVDQNENIFSTNKNSGSSNTDVHENYIQQEKKEDIIEHEFCLRRKPRPNVNKVNIARMSVCVHRTRYLLAVSFVHLFSISAV